MCARKFAHAVASVDVVVVVVVVVVVDVVDIVARSVLSLVVAESMIMVWV